MKELVQEIIKPIIAEGVNLPIEIGDTVLMGRFKNKKIVIKSISWNEKGDLLINGRPAAKFRIPQNKNESAKYVFTDELNHLIDEFLLTIDVAKILKEASPTSSGGADDGPSFMFSTFKKFKERGDKEAGRLGWAITNYILNDKHEFEDKDWRYYPDGPASSVSFFPAGAVGLTPNNQEDFVGTKAWNAWLKHIKKINKTLGWEFIQFLGKQENKIKDDDDFIKKQVMKDSEETAKQMDEEDPESTPEDRKDIQHTKLKPVEEILDITKIVPKLIEGLDVSIKQVHKVVTNESKAKSFINSKMKIFEKMDGTKLTLIRNKQPFDSKDYSKNWIIAYKGNIIYATEFEGVDDKKVKRKSVGTSQYKFVHNHLKKVHKGTGSVKSNTEFFIEFIQNKKTLTRDYKHKHGMFLVGVGRVSYDVGRGTVNSAGNLDTNEKIVNKFASTLKINTFPVLFEGSWKSESSISSGFKNSELRSLFNGIKKEIDFDNPMSIMRGMSEVFVSFQSKLGGKPEGVVIKHGGGKLYKIVQSDQYDKAVRGEKKRRWDADPAVEEKYWDEIYKLAKKLTEKLDINKKFENILKDYSRTVYSLQLREIKHPKKDLIVKQDDLFLTGKTLIIKQNEIGPASKKVGLFPVAGKPVHLGHWKVIQKAARDNDSLIIFTSTKGRKRGSGAKISGKAMQEIWVTILKKNLPGNAILKYAASPFNEILRELKFYNKIVDKKTPKFMVYSDKEDIKKWNDVTLQKTVPNLFNKKRVGTVGVSRKSTVSISGTQMRQFLENGQKEEFMKYLPPVSNADKEKIWELLS